MKNRTCKILRSSCKMFLIVFLFLTISTNCAKLDEVNDHGVAFLFSRNVPRLIYNVKKLAEHNYLILRSPTATACPEQTEKEEIFNLEQSFGKHSLFVRNIYEPFEKSVNINSECRNPFRMSVLYHTIGIEFQFGFEIYYEKPEFESETFTDSKRWQYDSITSTHTAKNRLKPLLHYVPQQAATIVTSIFPGHKVYLDDEIEMGFVWAMTFFMKFNFRANRLAQAVYDPFISTRGVQRCDDWNLGLEYYKTFGIPIPDLYSEENQKKMLEGIKLPVKNHDDQNEEDATCESEGECFTEWLSVPPGQLQFLGVGPVSCSYLLAAPVWKSTIDDVLKKLDNFIQTIPKVIGIPEGIMGIHSGIYGDLQLPSNAQNEKVLEKITLAENNIPVPDIIYKLIKYRPTACEAVLDANDLAKIPDELKDYLKSGYNEDVKPKADDKNDELEKHPKSENRDKNNQLDGDVKHEVDDGDSELKRHPEKLEKKKPSEDDAGESTKYDKKDDDEPLPDSKSKKPESSSPEYKHDESVLPDSKPKQPATSKNCFTLQTAMVVVVHNNPYFNPAEDKICNDMCAKWGWEEIQYRMLNGRRFKSKYIYCCKASDIRVREKLGLSNDKESEDSGVFALNAINLPQINKMGFAVRDLRHFIVNDYQKSFEGGQSEPADPRENDEAVRPINIVKYVARELDFLKMRKPEHDGDEPVKSETQFADDAEDLKNPSNKIKTK